MHSPYGPMAPREPAPMQQQFAGQMHFNSTPQPSTQATYAAFGNTNNYYPPFGDTNEWLPNSGMLNN
jgi:hypothetical protein